MVPSLAGTEAELLLSLKIIIAAARETGRAILLPAQGIYHAPNNKCYTRFIWSLFPLEKLQSQFGVTFPEVSDQF